MGTHQSSITRRIGGETNVKRKARHQATLWECRVRTYTHPYTPLGAYADVGPLSLLPTARTQGTVKLSTSATGWAEEHIKQQVEYLRCGGSEEELTEVLCKLASYTLSREVVVATELVPTLECLCCRAVNVDVALRAERLRVRLAELLSASDATDEVRRWRGREGERGRVAGG